MNKSISKDYAIEQYFNDIRNISVLSEEDERKFIEKAQQGDMNARDKVVSANLKLVTTLAGDYKNNKIQYLDFVQEGNIALMDAVMKYDIKSNNKFSTYASRVIKTAFRDLCDKNSRTIRLPANICRMITKISKYKAQYLQDYGEDATNSELVEYADGNISQDEIDTVMAYDYHFVSLDAPISGDPDDGTYGDIISENIDDDKEQNIDEALDKLPIDEFNILDHKFNITHCYNDDSYRNYEESDVGNALKHLANILKEDYGCSGKEISLL